MTIFQIIKELIDKITNRKLKLLPVGVDENYRANRKLNFQNSNLQDNVGIQNKIEMATSNEEVVDNSNGKVKKFLMAIGCQKEIFEKMKDFSRIDIETLKENVRLLEKYHYTKLELSKIITENVELLTFDTKEIKSKIKQLENIFEEFEIRHCIYSYPYCLTQGIEETLTVFQKYNIPLEIQKYVLQENASIIGIEKTKLMAQLDFIKTMCRDFEEFLVIIISTNALIGTNQLEVIRDYIKE